MDKYKSTEAYVMNELKQAHTRIEQLENNLDEVLKKLRAAECQVILITMNILSSLKAD